DRVIWPIKPIGHSAVAEVPAAVAAHVTWRSLSNVDGQIFAVSHRTQRSTTGLSTSAASFAVGSRRRSSLTLADGGSTRFRDEVAVDGVLAVALRSSAKIAVGGIGVTEIEVDGKAIMCYPKVPMQNM